MQNLSVTFPLDTFNTNQALLVVEDSDEDFTAFARVIKETAFAIPVYRACNGDDALDFLYHQGSYADPAKFPRPSVILMDLNLPGTDGREVIELLKQDKALKSIPIVALTTSFSPKDIQACYCFGVNSYLLKPIGVEAFKKTIQDFLRYWFGTVVLPNTER